MAKKLTFFLIFLTFISVFTHAAPGYVVFEEIVDGAEYFSYIEALTNAQNEHSGFIFCDTINNQIIVDEFDRDSLIVIDVEGVPVKAISYYSENYDTLFVYAIYKFFHNVTVISNYIISYDDVTSTTITPNIYQGDPLYSQVFEHLFKNISFIKWSDESEYQILFEITVHSGEWILTMGSNTDYLSTHE